MFSSMCFVYKEQFLLEVFQLQSQKCTIKCHFHSVHPPPLPFSAGGRCTSNETFKKGGLTGPPFLEGGCWERGGCLFSEEVTILEEILQNLEYLMTKTFINKNSLLCRN